MNKKENGFLKVLSYFLLTCVISFGFISIIATGGGGGGGGSAPPPDLGTAPEIWTVEIYDSNWVETYSFDIGEYFNYKVYATDPDKDMLSLYATQYHPHDSNTPYYGPDLIPLPSQPGVDVVIYNIAPIEVTGPSGTWRVEFQIEDSKGNESNVWKVYSTVSGAVDPNDVDDDGDGYTENQGDCNDNDASIHPGTTEVCDDSKDNDCDGFTDCADSECSSDPECLLLAKTELLKGYWYFYYTIISAFDHYYTLDTITGDTNSQGGYFIHGTDEYGDLVVASYFPNDGNWALLDSSSIIDRFYAFYTDGNTILANSCYYQINNTTGDWSSCYTLNGYKVYSILAIQLKGSVTEAIESEEMKAVEAEEIRAIQNIGETVSNSMKEKYREMKQVIDSQK